MFIVELQLHGKGLSELREKYRFFWFGQICADFVAAGDLRRVAVWRDEVVLMVHRESCIAVLGWHDRHIYLLSCSSVVQSWSWLMLDNMIRV